MFEALRMFSRPIFAVRLAGLKVCASLALFGLNVPASVQAQPLVDSINPLIGASTSAKYGEGKTFPGAATPFGLVQLSPDTITGGDNGSGYSWAVSYTHLRAHETRHDLVCRLLL